MCALLLAQLWRAALLLLAMALQRPARAAEGAAPLIIAHRGMPCELPEETLPGFQRAIDSGANFIEFDVVSTKDGHLVTRHDVVLDESTDVADHLEFAARRRSQVLPDLRNVTGFFTADLSLAELRTLRARQRLPTRDQSHNGLYGVPTLAEVLRLAAAARVGVYAETKQAAYHAALGLPLEARLLAALAAAGLPGEAVFLQSFELQSLERLHALLERGAWAGARPRLTWLLGSEPPACSSASVSDEQLDTFAQFGDAIGPDKALLASLTGSPECGPSPPVPPLSCPLGVGMHCAGRLADTSGGGAGAGGGLVARAHARGLAVHAWTFRNEGSYLALDFAADPAAELSYFAGPGGLGVDGVFADCASTALRWRAALHAGGGAACPRRVPAWAVVLATLAAVGAAACAGAGVALACLRWRRSRHAYKGLTDAPQMEHSALSAELPMSLRITPLPATFDSHASP